MTSGPDPGVPFTDRIHAGAALAARLLELPLLDPDPVVVALPRGGVPVGAVVADTIGAPLDVIIVRKLGVPSQPELAMGAIGEGGCRVLNHEVIDALRIPSRDLAAVEHRERLELAQRARRLRAGRPPRSLLNRTVVLVDDGLATGSTARAAMEVARAQGAQRVVLAVPVAPKDTVRELARIADAVVCVASPEPFRAIGQWYRDFRPITDDEVVRLLHG
jgi:putative phosphoribosyl transferase